MFVCLLPAPTLNLHSTEGVAVIHNATIPCYGRSLWSQPMGDTLIYQSSSSLSDDNDRTWSGILLTDDCVVVVEVHCVAVVQASAAMGVSE